MIPIQTMKGVLATVAFGIAVFVMLSLSGCTGACDWTSAIVSAADAANTELAERSPENESVDRATDIVGTITSLAGILVRFCEGTVAAIGGAADSMVAPMPTAESVVCPDE